MLSKLRQRKTLKKAENSLVGCPGTRIMAPVGFSHHHFSHSEPGAKLGESASRQSGLEADGASHALPSPQRAAPQMCSEPTVREGSFVLCRKCGFKEFA